MAFETFTAKHVVNKAPRVSILKQGNFSFNSGSMKILKGNSATHLQMLYDRKAGHIGFKPCRKNSPGAYTLREARGIGQLSGLSFLKHYGIPFGGKSVSHSAEWDAKEKMLVIKL